MRRFLLLALVVGTSASAADLVRGYVRGNGTYVAPHYRSTSDGTRANNWSSTGNSNPYTGEKGSSNPWAPKPTSTWNSYRR